MPPPGFPTSSSYVTCHFFYPETASQLTANSSSPSVVLQSCCNDLASRPCKPLCVNATETWSFPLFGKHVFDIEVHCSRSFLLPHVADIHVQQRLSSWTLNPIPSPDCLPITSSPFWDSRPPLPFLNKAIMLIRVFLYSALTALGYRPGMFDIVLSRLWKAESSNKQISAVHLFQFQVKQEFFCIRNIIL